ncbi:MAG: 3-ketoacyl-ACP reductase [Phycisphaerales bacterium]|nr:MAG: 3-ketoacyl-ACP reductase [Phycisphaerales bacterium]
MIDRRVALVTGGSRGIGRAVCVALARSGYAVVVNFADNLAGAQETAALCEQAGTPVEMCQCDVANRGERELMIQFVMERFGRVDCLVNNAGVAPKVRYDILQTPEDSYDEVLNVNLRAPYFLTQGVANEMIQLRQRGDIDWACIINVSSIRAYTVAVNYGEYCTSKAGLSMVTKLFAVRLAEFGIDVHEVSPGIIETDMSAPPAVRAAYEAKLKAGMTPNNRWGQPDEVALAVAAIARREFPFSTGQVFHVDGGWHLRHL